MDRGRIFLVQTVSKCSIKNDTLLKFSVFKKDGTVTKGNACGLNDGASAVVLASKSSAESLGLNKVAKIVCSAVVGWYVFE